MSQTVQLCISNHWCEPLTPGHKGTLLCAFPIVNTVAQTRTLSTVFPPPFISPFPFICHCFYSLNITLLSLHHHFTWLKFLILAGLDYSESWLIILLLMEEFFNFTAKLFHGQQSNLPALNRKSGCHFPAEKSLMAAHCKLLFMVYESSIIWLLTPSSISLCLWPLLLSLNVSVASLMVETI